MQNRQDLFSDRKSILQRRDRTFFSPNNFIQPAVNNDPQHDGVSLKEELESNGGLSMTPSRL